MRREAFGKATKEHARAKPWREPFRDTGELPDPNNASPHPPRHPRPVRAAYSGRRLAQDHFMSKPRPGEGACEWQPGNRCREERPEAISGLDIKFLCEPAGPCQASSRRGRGGGAGAAKGRSRRPLGSGFFIVESLYFASDPISRLSERSEASDRGGAWREATKKKFCLSEAVGYGGNAPAPRERRALGLAKLWSIESRCGS